MKYLVFIFLLAFSSVVYGQNTSISESQFIKIELGKIEKHLNAPELALNNEQSVKVRELITQKYAKVHKSWNSGLTKIEVSNRRNEIEKEYTPLIEGLLSPAQRMALLKATPIQIK